ncbi:MAG: hypothetical protein ACI4QN_02805 [Candidatus Coproplasma sp.]
MKRKKILFVCTGNTCRSPMAELILRSIIKKKKIKWWDVISCGIHAEIGSKIAENSKLALNEIGISSDKFAPRQLNQKLIESSVLVITMTSSQKQILEGCGNVVCMKDICGYDVPDPYGANLEIYRITRNAIYNACELIINNFILNYKENT